MLKSKRNIIDNTEYPQLMITLGGEIIVLFTAKYVGTVVDCKFLKDLGKHQDNWEMNSFIPFRGSVTLTED